MNKALQFRLNELESELELEMTGNELELMDSKLMNDPIAKIRSTLGKYDFIPVKRAMLEEI